MCNLKRLLFLFLFLFCNHCLNGKIIMVKDKSRVYYSLRTLCYITMEHLIKQNVVVSGVCLCWGAQEVAAWSPKMLLPWIFTEALAWLGFGDSTS